MPNEHEQYEALTQEELDALDAEALPRREAMSIIGPLPATPADSAATTLPEIVDAPE